MMYTRKVSRYPNPPPSLVIKPSAQNSPSRVPPRANRLTSSTSTPERMKVGQSLANQIYLGSLPCAAIGNGIKEEVRDDMLTVRIHQLDSPEHKLKYRSQSMSICNNLTLAADTRGPATTAPTAAIKPNSAQSSRNIATPGFTAVPSSPSVSPPAQAAPTALNSPALAAGQPSQSPPMAAKPKSAANHTDNCQINAQRKLHLNGNLAKSWKRAPTITVTPTSSVNKTILKTRSLDSEDGELDTKPKEHSNSKLQNGVGDRSKPKNSTLRQRFFDNYPSLFSFTQYKVKKKVSFALPTIERDISDISISSHLSAVSDCLVLDDDEEDQD